MAGLQKFLFDLKFDAPALSEQENAEEEAVEEIEEEQLPPEPPPPPTFSEEELAAAREAAYAEGLTAGEQKATAQLQAAHEQKVAILLGSINDATSTLLSEEAARVAQGREMTMQIAIAIARKILPDYIRRHGQEEIVSAISEILPHLMEEPRLVIKCAEQVLDKVSTSLKEQAAQNGYEGKLIFTPDPGMSEADCSVEWASGGLERDTARIWADVDRLVVDVLRANSPSVATVAHSSGSPSPTENSIPPAQDGTSASASLSSPKGRNPIPDAPPEMQQNQQDLAGGADSPLASTGKSNPPPIMIGAEAVVKESVADPASPSPPPPPTEEGGRLQQNLSLRPRRQQMPIPGSDNEEDATADVAARDEDREREKTTSDTPEGKRGDPPS